VTARDGDGTPSEQVETTLFRALIVLRLVVMVYAVTVNVVRFDEFAEPVLVAVALAVIVGWTAFTSWAYDAPRRRRLPLYAADLGVAVALVLSTPLVQSEAMLDRHASTVPTFWVMASVLAWAAGLGWLQGLLAAALVSVADVSVRTDLIGATWGNIFLLVLAAGVVGYTAGILRDAAEIRARAERATAIHEERARLARVVHDGVLQVLALVQRRAGGVGDVGSGEQPELAQLARLAGEQEAALRALVQYDARTRDEDPQADTRGTDLMLALEALQSPRVTVAGPAGAVILPAYQAAELAAVVSACLDNVCAHVGDDAPAWVFVEDLGTAVVVSVRDEGPGIPEGRLEQATQEGRLGVSSSILGRMAELGGTAELVTGHGAGTEWELTVPRI
jgi:signal transduction histidine kinase